MNPKSNGHAWSLKVVRGREPGRVFAPGGGEVVLGNAPGPGGLDLASQEGEASLKRMAARHALLDGSKGPLALRDLESPGGTFVNRQRVLPGQARPLRLGDLIQIGGVQLEVVAATATANGTAAPVPVTAPTKSGAFAYAMPGGPVCRSWDDVVTASAQRWEALREELTSGRLAGFLASIDRGDLAPSPNAVGSPDERLDTWLGSLPTARQARPELDVHPLKLLIKVTPGGGSVRRSIRVANVGLRLLRSTAQVEPSGTTWLKVAPEFAGRSFVTVEETDLIVEVAIPETLPSPLKAEVVVEGNGGSKRVAVTLEAKAAPVDFAGPDLTADRPTVGLTLAELIARQSPINRIVSWGLVALAVRLVVGVAGGSIGEDGMLASGSDSPSLGRVAVLMFGVGGLLGGILATRRGGAREGPTGAFAGGCAGVIASTAIVAACRSIEPALGAWSTSVVAVCLAWASIGAGLAAASTLFVKGKP